MSKAKVRVFFFEGAERTAAEIVELYYPAVAKKTLYSRLVASGATTRTEYMTYLATGRRATPPGVATRMRDNARSSTQRLTGERGCNFCQMMKPLNQLTDLKGKKICKPCRAQRIARLTTKVP